MIPAVVIVVLIVVKAFVMAGVAAGITVLLWLIRSLSPVGRRLIERMMAALARWVGSAVATLLLAPAFFVVMTWARLMNRLMGNDPLQLRSAEAPTFWLPSDLERRRARYVRSMFCTERPTGRRFSLLPVVALGAICLLAAELGLRWYGLATPLLYLEDVVVGYYPRPNQRVRHPGRIITINNFGMRSPDIAPHKAPGHFRILTLGDSTLAGTWVSNDELYTSLLQSNLNVAAGAQIFEVMNMGVNGWGPFHELGYVKKFGSFDADLAIICGPVWNCQRPLYGLERTPYYPAARPPRLALERVLYDLCWWYRAKCLGPPAWLGEEQRRLGLQAYADLARLLQQQGAEVVVEMLPGAGATLGLADDASAQGVATQLRELVGPLGVPVECAGPIFKGQPPGQKIYHDAAHFDRLGHRLYARYLADRLSQLSPRVRKALEGPK
jgi:hypothetical protein